MALKTYLNLTSPFITACDMTFFFKLAIYNFKNFLKLCAFALRHLSTTEDLVFSQNDFLRQHLGI